MDLMSRILAPGIFGADIEDTGQPVLLAPEEEALVAKAAPKRRREFALGRSCAHKALAALGHDNAVIGRDVHGAPLWPHQVVGSITHTSGYAAALVADARRFSGVGVDAEQLGGVTPNLWPRLFDAEECRHLIGLDIDGQKRAATLFFSAKEACHKAWGIKSALVFREIHIAPKDDGFVATRRDQNLEGRYAIAGGLIVTAAWF